MTLQSLLEAAKETNKEMGDSISYGDSTADGMEESSTQNLPAGYGAPIMMAPHGMMMMPPSSSAPDSHMVPIPPTSAAMSTSGFYQHLHGPNSANGPAAMDGPNFNPRRLPQPPPEEMMMGPISEAHRRQYALGMVPPRNYGLPMKPYPLSSGMPARFYSPYTAGGIPPAAWQWEGAYTNGPGAQESYGPY